MHVRHGTADTLAPPLWERPTRPREKDFGQDPFIVIWEVTQACRLACVHCRATAQPDRHPLELTTAEGRALIDQIACFDDPLFVLTGGDPLERPDLFDLIAYAAGRGLRVTLTPSATPRLTPTAIRAARAAGARRMALSLDGSDAARHDAFRQVDGSFAITMTGLAAARERGLPVQINTTVCRRTIHDLPAIGELVRTQGVALWAAFFLVPTGRGKSEDLLSARETEEALGWLCDFSRTAPFPVKTTAATHYRRVVLEQMRRERETDAAAKVVAFARHRANFASPDGIPRARRGVNDGNGFCFISHTGDVYPSGFLPVTAGNVRRTSVVDLYRHSPLFQRLRDPDALKGRCGVCEYRRVCGGSRARAFAVTGDLMAEDPSCAYLPRARRSEQHP